MSYELRVVSYELQVETLTLLSLGYFRPVKARGVGEEGHFARGK